MKRQRQAKILELVNEKHIETQEMLADILNREGFQVTQATVSRDIRELQLTKTVTTEGRQKYESPKGIAKDINEKYLRVLREGYVSADIAQNILVIKTVAGLAMAVAAALDALQWPEVVGCIAGDDTIMCAIRTAEAAKSVMLKIERIAQEK